MQNYPSGGRAPHRKKRRGVRWEKVLGYTAILIVATAAIFFALNLISNRQQKTPGQTPVLPQILPVKEPEKVILTGYLKSGGELISVYDDEGGLVAELVRGTEVTYEEDTATEDGKQLVRFSGEEGGMEGYVRSDEIADDLQKVITETEGYVRTSVDMIADPETGQLSVMAAKGTHLEILGFDRLEEDGSVHEYRVRMTNDAGEETEAFIRPIYLVETAEDVDAIYDEGIQAIHNTRQDRYGGGDGASLDYYPREKGSFEDNVMPDECRTLYMNCSKETIAQVDEYIAIADQCGINAFVVDIEDGGLKGYASPWMQEHAPSCYSSAQSSLEDYGAAIKKLKDAGYYVIGRLVVFADSQLITDHPEYAIQDTSGNPLKISGEYWPSVFCRDAWEYKVGLAKEAVELFGFNEIQFDYVRFPNGTYDMERAGTIDFLNTYGETKAQGVQRFLMYATDEMHDTGVYVAADVFGETSNDYVSSYGQYWPAVSTVVDVISAMPYPDHYGEYNGWKPWEHPYDIITTWGNGAKIRQLETLSPAKVRTWIQAYNAIRPPYNTYGPDEVGAEIRALRDCGFHDGYMAWHGASSLDKYRSLMSAFDL
ncbi:MAG: hypothetical protein IJJ34_05460 [Clostridia bacterium]|nr:hypothetical protein [Clostridia bacterium]